MLRGARVLLKRICAPLDMSEQAEIQRMLLWTRGEHLTGTNTHNKTGKDSGRTIGVWKREHGSNRGSTEEGRQKEILTKPRYTHKSPDTTRLLSVFYRAALRWRNSMTGQFRQRKIWSLSTLPPLAPLSLLFSVYPTWHHSVTSGPGSFFHHPPISSFPVLAFLLALYIPAVMFHSSVSIHLPVALLIPSHLLSSALIPPVSLPALPEPFPCGVPFPPTPLCFPHSSWFISSLLSVPFMPCTFSLYRWLILSPSYTFATIFPLTCLSLGSALSLFLPYLW